MKCEREHQVLDAVRNGLWTASLRAHARGCALCTQTELIAAALREDAAKLERRFDPAPPAMIWRRAQTRRRTHAVQRATRRPFLIVCMMSALYCVVFLLWGLVHLPPSVYRLFVTPAGLIGNVGFAAAALSGILIIAGSCLLVFESRR